MNSGNYGVSNSPISTPYQKVLFGEKNFEQSVSQYNTLEEKETLVAELKNLLQSQVLWAIFIVTRDFIFSLRHIIECNV